MNNNIDDKFLDAKERVDQMINKKIDTHPKVNQIINKDDNSFGNRLADKIAWFGGSWKFICIFVFIIVVWIISNNALLGKPFDPYPYILLNLGLSCLAAVQAPIIMMSQNRQESRDRERSEADYNVNIKSEYEINAMQEKLNLLIDQHKQLMEQHSVKLEEVSVKQNELYDIVINDYRKQKLSK